MTIHDDGKLCFQCKQMGELRKAHRIVPGKGPMCDEHFRDHMGWPQLSIEAKGLILRWKAATVAAPPAVPETSQEPETQIQPKEKPTVAKRLDEATKDAMRKDAAAGMNINAIAEKHHSSWPTVKNIVGNGHKAKKASAKSNGHIPLRVISPKAHALIEKWNTEANEAFAALPLEKKAELLGSLE